MRMFFCFFSGEGEALIFGPRIYIYIFFFFFFFGGGGLLSEALTIFLGGVDFCLN